jgi:hypothetical protein
MEGLFFESEFARDAVIFQDRLGLSVGVLLNAIGWSFARKHALALVCLTTVTLQAAQLAWLQLRPISYIRRRYSVTLLHRARIFLVVMAMSMMMSTEGIYPFRRAQQHPGSFRAFINVVVFPAVYSLAPILNHGLPFKTELLLAPLRLLIALKGAHHQALALRLANLEDWTQPACNAGRGAILAPALLHSEDLGNFCTELGAPFMLVLVHVLLGVVLPLQVGRCPPKSSVLLAASSGSTTGCHEACGCAAPVPSGQWRPPAHLLRMPCSPQVAGAEHASALCRRLAGHLLARAVGQAGVCAAAAGAGSGGVTGPAARGSRRGARLVLDAAGLVPHRPVLPRPGEAGRAGGWALTLRACTWLAAGSAWQLSGSERLQGCGQLPTRAPAAWGAGQPAVSRPTTNLLEQWLPRGAG